MSTQTSIFSNIQVALLTLVVYDYFLTLRCEVAYIWRQRFRLSSWLYLLNRYSLLALQASEIANLFIPSFCRVTSYMTEVFNIALLLCIASFSALRVYAIAPSCGASQYRWLTVPVFSMGLLPIGIDFFLFSRTSPYLSGDTCAVETDIDYLLVLQLTFASRICLVVADCLVLFIIWLGTRDMRKTANTARKFENSFKLSFAIMSSGTYFFVAALVLNVSMLVVLATFGASFVSPIAVALPSVLMSRSLLDLQHAALKSSSGSFGNIPSFDLDESGRTLPKAGPEAKSYILPEIDILSPSLETIGLDEWAASDVGSKV